MDSRQFEYRQDLDALHFTEEQKSLLAERVSAAVKQAVPRRRHPVRRIVVLAAAAAMALIVGAGAAGGLGTASEIFAPIFGGSVAQTEVINKIGRPVGASDTDNGVTITADAIIGDKYNACVVFTIRRDDGTPLLPEGVDARNLLMGGFGGVTVNTPGGSHGSAWFLADPADPAAVQLVEALSSDRPMTGSTAAAEFEDLCRWDDVSGEAVPVAEGHWKFRFRMDYEDSSVTLGGGETFEQGSMTFTIDEITVSPVAVQVSYIVDSEVQWSNAPSGREDPADARQVERYLENVEILLTKTDGTVIDLSSSGGSIKPENGVTVCTKGSVMEEIIPLEELASISVGGVVYDIPQT